MGSQWWPQVQPPPPTFLFYGSSIRLTRRNFPTVAGFAAFSVPACDSDKSLDLSSLDFKGLPFVDQMRRKKK